MREQGWGSTFWKGMPFPFLVRTDTYLLTDSTTGVELNKRNGVSFPPKLCEGGSEGRFHENQLPVFDDPDFELPNL